MSAFLPSGNSKFHRHRASAGDAIVNVGISVRIGETRLRLGPLALADAARGSPLALLVTARNVPEQTIPLA